MNKIATLAKIANRLDSLGLTREADALDNIIRKIAGDPAPEMAGQKYIDAYGSSLGNRDQTGLIAELIKDLDEFGTTDSGGIFSTGTTKIESIMYYLYLNTNVSDIKDVFVLLKEAGFDTSGYADMRALLESEDDGLGDKSAQAIAAGVQDYNTLHPKAAEPEATPVVKPRAPVKDWAYYIRNTPVKDGLGGQQVADAWKSFTSSKIGSDSGFTPDYNSFVAWWKKNSVKTSLVSPAQVTAALNNAVQAYYTAMQPKQKPAPTPAQVETKRREDAAAAVAGGVPPAIGFREQDDSGIKDFRPAGYTVPGRWEFEGS
jgi:hypothetical protein